MELDRFVNISPLTCGTVLIFFNRMHWRGTGGGSFSSRFCCALLCELLQCAALGSCGKWKWKSFSRVWLCNPMDYMVHRILQARILELEAFPFSRGSSQPRDQSQVSPIAVRFLYQLNHKGSPRKLEWAAYPFSSRSSWPRNWTGVSCIGGGFFTNWAIREPSCRQWRKQYSPHLV